MSLDREEKENESPETVSFFAKNRCFGASVFVSVRCQDSFEMEPGGPDSKRARSCFHEGENANPASGVGTA